MKTYVFKGPKSTYGFDTDQSGSNLPTGQGPWKPFKEMDLNENDPPRIGGPSKEILDGIAANGYFVTKVEMQFTVGPADPA